MITDFMYQAAPTAVRVDQEKFEQMVQHRLRYWNTLADEISKIRAVTGIDEGLFSAAKAACSRYRKGDRSQETLLAMGKGWADWHLCCQERDGRAVYLRGQKDAA